MSVNAAGVRLAGRARTRTRLGRIAGIAAAVLVALSIVAYFGVSTYVADKLSRPDHKVPAGNPASYGLKYEDVTFPSASDGIALSGWLIDSPGDKVIVMMHGRGMARDLDEAYLEKAALFERNGYDVFMFDFRAHGLSAGERYSLGPWETRDVAGALDYLKGRGYTEFGTYAVSMGAGTSLLAAPDHPEIKALVVDAPYANLPALIDDVLPKESGLPRFFNPGILSMAKLVYGLDFSTAVPTKSMALMGDRPVLHIHSRDGDPTMPIAEAYALQEAAADNPNYTLWLAPGEGHVHAYTNNTEEYTRRMITFYDTYLGE